jgi:DNA-binding transcriptional regulator LsrR (DeoR family)
MVRPERISEELTAEEEIMVKVSWLYYRENYTQQEIAQKLNLSRSKVGRLLAKALKEGIVEIKLSPMVHLINLPLENELEKRFNLREALISPSGDRSHTLLENLGRTAARFLDRSLHEVFTLGISMGTSVAAVLPFVSPRNETDSTVITLSGGFTQPEYDTTAYDISWPLANTLGAKLEVLYCPLVAESKEVKETFLSDRNLCAQLKRAEEVDIALVSIGYPHMDMPLHRLGICTTPDVTNLLDAGAVGEIITNFINMDGEFVHTDLYDRSIGVSIDVLKKIPTTVAIAGGLAKTRAILGALRTDCLDVLITDNDTAEAILKLDDEQSSS